MIGLDESLIYELKYADIVKKQKSIVKLFPTFYNRVKKVMANGGIKSFKADKDLWTFEVNSGDPARHAKGITYHVQVYFAGVPTVLEQLAKDKQYWTRDGKKLNLNALGRGVIYGAELLLSTESPGDQFWGPNYQRTMAGAQWDREETRPPNIRNPQQFGLNGKHVQLVLDVLPFYTQTMAKELRKYYSKLILDLEKKTLHAEYNPKQTAAAVEQEPEEQPEAGPRDYPEEESEETEEENPDQKIGL